MKLLLICTIQILSLCAFCQKTELAFNMYSGASFYRGSGAASATKMITGFGAPGVYISNVYGKKPALGFSFEAELTRVSKSNFLCGAGVSYDIFKGKTIINEFLFNEEMPQIGQSYIYTVEGKSILTNNYVNINPFAGKRWLIKKLTLDVTAGADFGFCLNSTIKANASVTFGSNKIQPTSSLSNPYPPVDIRPRIQLKAAYKRTGIIAGYSLGLTNYQTIASGKAYLNFFRLGLSYRVK